MMVIRLFIPRWLRSPSASSTRTLTRQSLIGRFDVVLPPPTNFSSSLSSSADGNLDGIGRDAEENHQQHHHQTQEPPRRRTRRGTRPLQDNAMPSLADFIHRAKVLKQYRNFVRLAQYVDGKDSICGHGATTTTTADNNNHNKAIGCRAALDEVRIAFKMGMKIGVDAMAKNMAVVEGERKLRELERTVGYYPTRDQSTTTDESSYDADSWINIQDEADPRGRVGVQWPWEQGNGRKQ